MTGRNCIIFCVVTFATPLITVAADASTKPSEVSVAVPASTSWKKRVSMTIHSEMYDPGKPSGRRSVIDLDFVRHGDQMVWRGKSLTWGDDGKLLPDESFTHYDLFRDDLEIEVLSTAEGPILLARVTTVIRPEHRQITYEHEEHSSFLDGDVDGSSHMSVADILAQSDVTVRGGEETVAGEPCQVLEGYSKQGHVTAWVARHRGNILMKYVIEKTGDDLYNGKKTSADVKRGLKAATVTEILSIGGTYIATKGEILDSVELTNGRKNEFIVKCQRTNINLHPDLAETRPFDIQLPEGTKMGVAGNPRASYQWKSGQMVSPAGVVFPITGAWAPPPIASQTAAGARSPQESTRPPTATRKAP